MSKKIIISVDLRCSKCRLKVMKTIAPVKGITSIVLNPSNNTVTFTGEADLVYIVNKLRKFQSSVSIISVGTSKEYYYE